MKKVLTAVALLMWSVTLAQAFFRPSQNCASKYEARSDHPTEHLRWVPGETGRHCWEPGFPKHRSRIAQSVEHRTLNPGVARSSRAAAAIPIPRSRAEALDAAAIKEAARLAKTKHDERTTILQGRLLDMLLFDGGADQLARSNACTLQRKCGDW